MKPGPAQIEPGRFSPVSQVLVAGERHQREGDRASYAYECVSALCRARATTLVWLVLAFFTLDTLGSAKLRGTMAVRVQVEPEEELTPRERNEVVADVNLFIALRNRLAHRDLQALRHELAHILVLDRANRSPSQEIHLATGGPVPSESEQVLLGFRSLLQFFEARRDLLDEALTAPQAAELLGVSRQTPLNRARDNTLLAVLDRGAYRFPVWQFDPQGEDGVLPGLPEVLDALEPQQPFAKLVWLRRPNQTLGGREPVELLRDRELEPVIDAAHAAAELP